VIATSEWNDKSGDRNTTCIELKNPKREGKKRGTDFEKIRNESNREELAVSIYSKKKREREDHLIISAPIVLPAAI